MQECTIQLRKSLISPEVIQGRVSFQILSMLEVALLVVKTLEAVQLVLKQSHFTLQAKFRINLWRWLLNRKLDEHL